MVYAEAGMTNTNNGKGKVVIVSGPSGVGKSTICKEIIKRLDYVYLSVSVTTRPKSETEVDGKDYWFISDEDFRERIDKGLLLEYAEVFGHLYGTPKDKVDEALQVGKVVILEIDVQGATKARVVYPEAVMIFILAPSEKDLAERLNHRGREAEDVAEEMPKKDSTGRVLKSPPPGNIINIWLSTRICSRL